MKDPPAAMKNIDIENVSSDCNGNENGSYEDSPLPFGFWQSNATRMARNPCIHLCTSLIIGIALSYVALVIGEFSVSANTGGWESRGTLISDRHTQLLLTQLNMEYLFHGGDAAWEDLINNVQPGWADDDDDATTMEDGESSSNRRQLSTIPQSFNYAAETPIDMLTPHTQINASYKDNQKMMNNHQRKLPFMMTPDMKRKLQEQSDSMGQQCDISLYYSPENLTAETRLWPIWKVQQEGATVLDSQVLHDMCVAEQNTMKILEDEGLCFGCDDGCLPPFSIVLYARLKVENGMSMSCAELKDAWGPYTMATEEEWKTCVQDVKATASSVVQGDGSLPESCPEGFYTTMVDESFDDTLVVSYTSSIFPTTEKHVEDLYDIRDSFDRGSDLIKGVYDTQYEDFLGNYLDGSLARDMSLAMASAIIVAIAMIVHTKSLFISLVGLMQIILSFPLAYFVYKIVAGLDFFPFLNFIGIFVVFALGADDVFVAVDKWKNARLEHPKASTEFIAATALPDAAGAMFLTTITTAIAFFGTAICPVAPVKMFAIFCGLLIVFDYIMNVLLVFPALCIYDTRTSCFFRCCCCAGKNNNNNNNDASNDTTNNTTATEPIDNEQDKPSLIRRVLLCYYNILHFVRWPLLVACMVGLGLSIYYASTLDLPTSSDVRLLDENHELEQSYLWRSKILYNALIKESGSEAHMIWGVKPDDTGDHNDPSTFSQLVLDDTFDPSTKEAQEYLTNFCTDIFDQDFAIPPSSDFICPMNKFDLWLQEQANSSDPESIYLEHCDGAAGIPMSQDDFNACIVAWAQQEGEMYILSRQGKVVIMSFPFTSRVRYDNHYDILDNEWKLIENWVSEYSKKMNSPESTKNGYFSSEDFWWYDTNGQMLKTAYSSSAIALGAAALVILFSSRSFTLTLFATIAVGYVLTSVTATLVGLGWTLGFLESICFAILIGISVDFVIHFSHAYSSAGSGDKDRASRTKFALIAMGPSILAAAFTTISSAIIMLFTVILFFQKFALILFMTVIQATIGSFVVFLVLSDTLGPSNPTSTIDGWIAKCGGGGGDGGSKSGRSGGDRQNYNNKSTKDEDDDDDEENGGDETEHTDRMKEVSVW